jgi:hypothetical protein
VHTHTLAPCARRDAQERSRALTAVEPTSNAAEHEAHTSAMRSARARGDEPTRPTRRVDRAIPGGVVCGPAKRRHRAIGGARSPEKRAAEW